MTQRAHAVGLQWVAVVVLVGVSGLARAQQVQLPGRAIPKFVEPLPTFSTRADATRSLRVTMLEVQQQVLPAALYPATFAQGTYVWVYQITELNADGSVFRALPPTYPAITIVARRGVPTQVRYVNELRAPFLQTYTGGGTTPVWIVDQTLNWADPFRNAPQFVPYAGPVPTCVHLHGGEVPGIFDGGPDAWFTPDEAYTGPGFVTSTYEYPNGQEAAITWFHDHALGATRLNPFCGLAGFYLLRDPDLEPADLPAGPYDVELAIQDRLFDVNGQLMFPALGINPEHPYWVPEYFGDTIVVNGKTWPYFNVEPRRYRFRLLNGSNARFYNMSLIDRATGLRSPIWVVGGDAGFLDAPRPVTYLLLAPGERADVIVDFTALANATITVDNNARAPYPVGTPADPRTVGQILQFRVVSPLSGTDTSADPAAGIALRPSNPLVRLNPSPATVPRRILTLNEVMGPGGPLEILLNNSELGGLGVSGSVTERPRVGSTEIWEIVNISADTHPIHTHLVNFQVINRQKLDAKKYDQAYNASFPGGLNPADGLTYPPGVLMPGYGPPLPYGNAVPGSTCGGNPDPTPFLKGAPALPAPHEQGWKDTAQMHPGEVTRIAVRWAPTHIPVDGVVPGQNLYPFDPTALLGVLDDGFGYPGGPGYVWHCHIIDHEDNEMMRRYEVGK